MAAGVKVIMEYHLWRPEGSWHCFLGFQTMVAQTLCKYTEYFSGLCRNVSSFLQKTAEILSLYKSVIYFPSCLWMFPLEDSNWAKKNCIGHRST